MLREEDEIAGLLGLEVRPAQVEVPQPGVPGRVQLRQLGVRPHRAVDVAVDLHLQRDEGGRRGGEQGTVREDGPPHPQVRQAVVRHVVEQERALELQRAQRGQRPPQRPRHLLGDHRGVQVRLGLDGVPRRGRVRLQQRVEPVAEGQGRQPGPPPPPQRDRGPLGGVVVVGEAQLQTAQQPGRRMGQQGVDQHPLPLLGIGRVDLPAPERPGRRPLRQQPLHQRPAPPPRVRREPENGLVDEPPGPGEPPGPVRPEQIEPALPLHPPVRRDRLRRLPAAAVLPPDRLPARIAHRGERVRVGEPLRPPVRYRYRYIIDRAHIALLASGTGAPYGRPPTPAVPGRPPDGPPARAVR